MYLCSPHRIILSKYADSSSSKVTVVIPLYNYAHTVVETLESVRAQTEEFLDIVVVEDCSTDNSLEVAADWIDANKDRFRQVRLVQHISNEGLPGGRNTGFSIAETDFVFVLDADNIIYPRCVSRCIDVLENCDAGAAYTQLVQFGDIKEPGFADVWNRKQFLKYNYIDAMAMIRKFIWEQVGGYTRMAVTGWEDYEFWCKFVEHGIRALYIPELLCRYRVHGSSMLRSVTNRLSQRENLIFEMLVRHPWLEVDDCFKSDEKIFLQRYSQTRRQHLLSQNKSLLNGIKAEKEQLKDPIEKKPTELSILPNIVRRASVSRKKTMKTCELQKKIGKKWSDYFEQDHQARIRWWQSSYILKCINEKVAGKPLEGASQGLVCRAKEIADGRNPFRLGVSVGCGNSGKEISCIIQGLVDTFVLFELSPVCIKQGKELARKVGVEDKVHFVLGDAFETVIGEECFDLVYWNNSLHHMLDVEKAVRWSYHVLKKGGLFFMDDFVGPNRFQWSEKMLTIASRVRSSLPEKYLVMPGMSRNADLSKPMQLFPKVLKRPNVQDIISDDPSEAADSEQIIPSVKRCFPNAEITLTGGVVYHLALSDILQNFDEVEDKFILDILMIIDDLCADLGETHYATALAIK